MEFGLSEEQQLIIKSTRDFVEQELYPHELEVEQSGVLRPELLRELKAKAIEAGLYAANMPTEVGGAGLDAVSWILYEKELGRTSYVLHYTCVARPSNILLPGRAARALSAGRGARREIRLPGYFRTRRRLGYAQHEDLSRAAGRRLRH
jgi:alkylation response protein AidB-like acyl-CoA dehydrogenase